MCEFCVEHGEGKKWYLQMKNYSKELFQQDLSIHQKTVKVYIDPHRCFGCGVCRAEYQNNAILLVPRHERPEVANVWLGEPSR